MAKIGKRTFREWILILLTGIVAGSATIGPSSAIRIPLAQRIELTEHLKEALLSGLNRVLEKKGEAGSAKADLRLVFDLKRLEKDFTESKRQWESLRLQAESNQEGRARQFMSLLSPSSQGPSSRPPKVREPLSSWAFGELNVPANTDNSQSSIEVLDHQNDSPKHGAITVIPYLIPSPELRQFSYEFEPIDYVQRIEADITVADSLNPSLINILKEQSRASLRSLGLPEKVDFRIAIAAAVATNPQMLPEERRPNPAANDGKTFWRDLAAPGVLLVAAMTLSFVLWVSARTLGSQIVKGLAGVKNRPNQSAAPTAQAVESSTGQSSQHTTQEGSPKYGNLPSKQPSLHDMERPIAKEIESMRLRAIEIAQKSPRVCAEFIKDSIEEENGAESVKALLEFLGYEALSSAMSRLPASYVTRLEDKLEMTGNVAREQADGSLVAERLYRYGVARLAFEPPGALIEEEAREILLGVEDQSIGDIAAKLAPEHLAPILRILSHRQRASLLRKVPAETMQAVLGMIDSTSIDESVVENLRNLIGQSSHLRPRIASSREKMLIKLARHSSLEDEDALISIIPRDNWDIRKNMMKERFFYRDLWAIPPKQLRELLDGMQVSARGELIYLAEPELRTYMMSIYLPGSRLREMIQSEVDLIANNPRKKQDVERRRYTIWSNFLGHVQKMIWSVPGLIDEIIDRLQHSQTHGSGRTGYYFSSAASDTAADAAIAPNASDSGHAA